MVESASRAAAAWLWATATAAQCREQTDGDLLAEFVRTRSEPAFRELVRRLGPAVYGVCRRHLGPTPDADDAFQTAFVVLAKKAGTVRPPGRVAAWLYGVASLAARKAKAVRARRLARERAVFPLPDVPAPEDGMTPDLSPAVDAELARLPEKFRLPILLCGPRGLTVGQAAAELGWPAGTVASRLSRGRVELAKRLAKRGIVIGLVGGWCGPAAGVPPRLIESTAAAACGGAVPPAVSALTSEVVNAMQSFTLRKIGAGLVLAGAVAVGGGGWVVSTSTAAPVPVASTDPKATLDRVKLDDVSGLLRQESVRKEVGLSDDDYKTLSDFRKEKQGEIQKQQQADFQAQIQAQGGGRGGAITITTDNAKYAKLQADAHAEYAKKVGEMVKPAGVKRLKQAVLQAQGPRALLDRRVIRELGLSAEQEDKIDALLAPAHADYITNDKVAKLAEDRDAELAAVLKVLSADQTKKWDALVGKSLPTADLIKASPMSEDAMRDQAGGFGIGGGIFIGPAVPAIPLPVAPPVPAPAPEEKK